MLIDFLGAIWRRLPGGLRRRVMRFGRRRFTATAGALIFDSDNRILLLDHVFRPDSGWGIPGGFLNRGEQPEAGLRRELREEVGLELDSVELLFTRSLYRQRQIEIYFRAKAIGTPRPRGLEIKRAQWFPLDALPEELPKDQRQLIQRAIDP
jgi:ADP-ribose pyrophosphatase YjhB (NUDIX family)